MNKRVSRREFLQVSAAGAFRQVAGELAKSAEAQKWVASGSVVR